SALPGLAWKCATLFKKSKKPAIPRLSQNLVAKAAFGPLCVKKVHQYSVGQSGRWRRLPNKPWQMQASGRKISYRFGHIKPICASLTNSPNNCDYLTTSLLDATSLMREIRLPHPFHWPCTDF